MDANTIIENYLIENNFEDLKDYEGIYKINKEGQIWSIKFNKELKYTNEKGVDRIGLITNKKSKQYTKKELLDIQYNEKINSFIHQQDLTDFEDLKGYEEFYKINRNGEIWSCNYNKIMTPQLSEDKYLKIILCKNTIKFHTSIHRLLALQYIQNPDNLPEIDHIDRNKANNSLDNLRWVDKLIQNNNKSNCIHLKNEEELQQRTEDLKEYKRKWAEQNRRAKGIEAKGSKQSHTKEYNKLKMREKREKLTEEEKEQIREERRKKYAEKEQTEDQKEKAKERAKKQSELIKEDPIKAEQIREYKKLKAREYREKKKQEEK